MSSHRHFILHKPKGYLSQFVYNQSKRKNKKLLGELSDFPENIMAIGRLDKSSEGLLLLTTDGAQSELVRSRSIEKEYYVKVEGKLTNEAIEEMRAGIEISLNGHKYLTKKCKIERISSPPILKSQPGYVSETNHRLSCWISITLTEGKFRQIRKMTHGVGHPTLRLIRIRIGHILLGDIAPGGITEVEGFGFE